MTINETLQVCNDISSTTYVIVFDNQVIIEDGGMPQLAHPKRVIEGRLKGVSNSFKYFEHRNVELFSYIKEFDQIRIWLE